MTAFLKQKRPDKVKEIYSALKRDHPEMPAEMKARIAARQGKPGKQKQGPPYKGPIKSAATAVEHAIPPLLSGLLMQKAVAPNREETDPTAGIGSTLLGIPASLAGGAVAHRATPQAYKDLVKRVAGTPGSGILRTLAAGGMAVAPSIAGGAAGGGLAGLLAHIGKKKKPEYEQEEQTPPEEHPVDATVMPDQKTGSLRTIINAGLAMAQD